MIRNLRLCDCADCRGRDRLGRCVTWDWDARPHRGWGWVAFFVVAMLLLGQCSLHAQDRRTRVLQQVDRAVAGLERASSPDSVAFWSTRLEEASAAWAALEGSGPIIPGPNPDPGEPDDGRMIRGAYPLLGYGARALQACGPPGGGDWNVQVLNVTAASVADTSVTGSRSTMIRQADPAADLTVIVYSTGGHDLAGSNPWIRLPRRRCIFDAAHTAPATYYLANSDHIRGGGMSDLVVRGLGFLPTRASGGVLPTNQFFLECGRDSHVDMLSLAFASNDLIRTTPGIGGGSCNTERTTVARVMVGPTGGGNAGRAGGPTGSMCGGLSYVWWMGFENQRRNPAVDCGPGRVNVTNVVCFNSTDCGRYGDFVDANLRGILSVGGPVTGCAVDRAVTWFEGNGNQNQQFTSSIFLESIESRPTSNCTWSPISALWEGPHTVFHYSRQGTPVPFGPHGVAEAHPDPDHAVTPLPPHLLEAAVPSNVGANFRLTCDGLWRVEPNGLDAESFARFAARDGASSSWDSLLEYEAAHGTVETPPGAPCPDSNANGIPDAIEARWGNSDPGKLGPSGRPQVLEWLEGYGRVGS